METRKETLSTLKMCRFCLATDETLIPLYDNKIRAPKNSVPFALKILACIAIEIFPSDNMPQYICQRCKLFMELSYAFKQLCRQADEAILQFIQNGTPLAPMPWPGQLTKVYKSTNKAEVNVVKTVVQGGATVKVMAEEVSDSEEGEEDNVYNVKIGDGSEEGKSIKFITSVDKQNQSKRGRQGSRKNSEVMDSSEVGLVESRCWACDECECTYPLEQLLSLHKTQKHRDRKVACDECGGKFFSNYDLEMHKLTHSSEMPFQCVACDKKFRRLILLKRHEKIMHSELPQQSCLKCPATFLSIEELEAHQQKHQRHAFRPFICFICNKRFHDKTILQKHTMFVHNKKPAFTCQYCTEQFPSVAKLTRHVREHAGAKAYPCKHCDKSFTKSHHYTRHLRLKHSQSIRTAGPYNEADIYRCEECEESFTNQDELMYHSALHATRNLTCPLCQEKFDDVDTVTAHIKSHVNGTEFMCDFCELIFTSKDKLENHIARTHDEELLVNDQEIEQDESSMDMDAEDEDDDNAINIKEEDGHMVVEIKKADEYMLPNAQKDDGEKTDNTQSEDSDACTDSLATDVEVQPTPKNIVVTNEVTLTKMQVAPHREIPPAMPPVNIMESNVADVLRKADEIKRKVQQQFAQHMLKSAANKAKAALKVESSTAATGASDKSLRLLEKELQDLKRTNSKPEVVKTPPRSVESLKTRRPQLYSSTPKIRATEKKEAIALKPIQEKTPTIIDKKQPERKTKDVKETKSNNNSIKGDKELKGNGKEEKEAIKEEKMEVSKEEKKEVIKEQKKEIMKEDKIELKEKEAPKPVTKNGANEASPAPPEDSLRRSTRPSKIKDYAKFIRDSSMNSDDNESDNENDDLEEYKELEKTPETSRIRSRRASKATPAPTPVKTPTSAKAAKCKVVTPVASVTPAKPVTPTTTVKPVTSATPAKSGTPATPATAPRKRGRPRKEPQSVVPTKIKKDEPSEDDTDAEAAKSDPIVPDTPSPLKDDPPKENGPENIVEGIKTPEANKLLPYQVKPGVLISPTGHTLKKIPVKALPPGVKPLPLPVNSRMTSGEVCEMQIGKKMVKVQKIVMTKAEVEAMAKKGLVEMKDGTMVLKQGIKLPTTDPATLKSTLIGDGDFKLEKPAPTRCNFKP